MQKKPRLIIYTCGVSPLKGTFYRHSHAVDHRSGAQSTLYRSLEDHTIYFGCSAIQMVLYQRLLEKYGGDGWTFEKLPLLISTWLSDQKEKEEIQKYLV